MTLESSAGVLALDHLSEQLLAAAADLRVAVARTAVEREAAFRLRHEQVTAGRWTDLDLPGGLERDDYDDDALHVCAWRGAALVGTVRVVR